MHAEVVAIGDELTSGRRLDTNSQWLSQQLALLGVPVLHHATVGDELEAIVAVLATACQRSDIVVVSGGLGPTADDLTRQALSTLADRPLVQDDQVLDHIRALFASRGRVMPERNVIQSHFPQGSRPIDNPHGTAPGIQMAVTREERPDVALFALPGVPAEMTEMWNASVVPAIAERLGPQRRVIRQREIRCFGAGESEIESRLPDLVCRGQDPVVGITASQATITLRVTAEGSSVEECKAKIEPTLSTIYGCLGPLVYGEGNDELQDAVACLLSNRRAHPGHGRVGHGGPDRQLAGWSPGQPRLLPRRSDRERPPDPGQLSGGQHRHTGQAVPRSTTACHPHGATPCGNDSPATMGWPSDRSRPGTVRRRRARRSTSP